jgi:chromosome segregation protein
VSALYLKSLTLKGFKSFATPTTFAFEPGVTCVVGPNGSGKSNVVDALAWVMGEQGAKTLRGGKMEDVIFAGTSTKGPLGRAEVQLTIDNTDGALPIDYTEVTISRTIYRNGGSEYAINGEACRLLDVQELLSDSGLGREMHVIVGQGQLDSVLKATPEERRGFIEEAAGILKHRRRKEKTERKLEAMQVNLTRLSDLAGEVRRQLKPLGQQAETARQAQGIASVVRDARSRIYAAELVELQRAVDETADTEAERKAERNILQTILTENQVRLQELEAAQVSTQVDAARNLAYRFDSVAERYRSLLNMASQRVSLLSNQGNIGGNLPDPAMFEAQAAEAAQEVTALEATVVELRAALAEAEAAKNLCRDALEAFDSEVAEQSALISKFDLELGRLSNDAAVAESRLTSLRDEVLRHEQALANAAERAKLSAEEYDTADASLRDSHQGDSTEHEQRYEAASAQVAQTQARIDTLREELHTAERNRESLAAKRSALNLTLDQKDGATALVAAGLRGIRGLIANHVKIEPGFEGAIAAALGSLADAIVADTREAGIDALEHLKTTDGGRVELVIADVDAGPGKFAAVNVAGARAATDVVAAPSGILALLQNVVIADDLAAAKRVFAATDGLGDGSADGAGSGAADYTVITRDGDVLSRAVLRGGSGRKTSKVELVAERDAAEAALAKTLNRVEELRQELAEARGANEAAREAEKQALAQLKAHDNELAANAEKLGRLRVQAEAAQAELDRLALVAANAAEKISEAEQKLADAVAAHDAFAAKERPVIQLDDRASLVANLEQERQRELEIRVDLGAAQERLRVERERVVLLGRQLVEANAAQERAKAAIAAQRAKLAAANRIIEVVPNILEHLAERAAVAKAHLQQLESARANQNAELVRLRGETAEIQMKLSTLTQSVHDIEMANHEKRITLANLAGKAYDELGLQQDVLVAEFGPQLPVPVDNDTDGATVPFNMDEQRTRLANAERLLERLGRVNPLALEEFAALEQRHKFLTEQLEDLTKTRKDLIQIIEELDQKMQHIFGEAFEDTRAAFERVFPILFPGGQGNIFLTDPENLLTTGIEVTVKPAGKRIERLSLLSGGERSLAAVALLIAIFKARPSPFYVMDEVEAALDDANLGRLLQIFQDLRTNSQLIIITHQKRTMEIADALYGVSMRQDGISAVVGQRIAEKR